tara:strand:- start:2656 stop:2970 length:315 start_codon:yes stop_codon:yes gene_type:complete
MIKVTFEEDKLIREKADKLIAGFLESEIEEDWFEIKANGRFFYLNFYILKVSDNKYGGLFGCLYYEIFYEKKQDDALYDGQLMTFKKVGGDWNILYSNYKTSDF